MEIVKLSGLSYPTVRKAIDDYDSDGAVAIRCAPRGRNQGDGRSLRPEQEEQVRRTICDKRPEQLKMDFALWARGAVMQLIELQCGVALSIRAVGNYLKRWASPRKSPSSALTSNSPRPSKPGYTSSTPPLRLAPRPMEAKCTGATRPRWRLKVFECRINRGGLLG